MDIIDLVEDDQPQSDAHSRGSFQRIVFDAEVVLGVFLVYKPCGLPRTLGEKPTKLDWANIYALCAFEAPIC